VQGNDDLLYPKNLLEDSKEPQGGPTSLKSIKTDEVFVKIEPFDFDDYDTYFDQESIVGGESSASDVEPSDKLIPKNRCAICQGIFNSEFQLKKHVGFRLFLVLIFWF
jgi:hypothetical protein